MEGTRSKVSDTVSESAAVPQEYYHRFNYARATLAWLNITTYVLWYSLRSETVNGGEGMLIVTKIDSKQLLIAIVSLVAIITITVLIVQKLPDPSLSKSFLANQFHIAMFPTPQLVTMAVSSLTLIATLVTNVCVAIVYFRRVRREQSIEHDEDKLDFLQVLIPYVLKGVPNVSKSVSAFTHSSLAPLITQFAKWHLLRRYHDANLLPLNVLARRTVTPAGMLALAAVSAVGFALPSVVQIVATAGATGGPVASTQAARAVAFGLWLAATHVVSAAYLAVTVCRYGGGVSIARLTWHIVLSSFVHSAPSFVTTAAPGGSLHQLIGTASRISAVQIVVHAVPTCAVAALCCVQFRSLQERLRQPQHASEKVD